MSDLQIIWKYILPSNDSIIELAMPAEANVLCVQAQGDNIVLWAIVDPNAERETRRFRVFGTGQAMPNPKKMWYHIGTCQMLGGALIWHVFEDIK